MPTTQASTGVSAGRNGNEASLPRTKNTCSPTPAPTASTATSVRPAGARSGDTGCSSSNLWPLSSAALMLETTSPITRASCTMVFREGAGSARRPRRGAGARQRGCGDGLDVDAIDDADDRGVHGTVLHAGRHAGGTAAHD